MFSYLAFVLLVSAITNVYGWGTKLWVTDKEINDASGNATLPQLFRKQIDSKRMVIFGKDMCGLTRASKRLMDEKQPNTLYYYFDYDTQGMGIFLMGESLKISRSTWLPDIYICSRFIGGLKDLQRMQDNGSLTTALRGCNRS